jgi:hypothetical protein
MDDARRKVLYNACNPEKWLEPESDFNVDLDTYGPGGSSVRGMNWVKTLTADIDLSEDPQRLFITGLSGSGKTTEFRRLERHLETRGYLPVYINSDDLLDMSTPIELADILITIFFEVEQAVRALPGFSREDFTRSGLFEKFWEWLEITDIKFTQIELGAKGGKAVFALRDDPNLRGRIRKRMESQVTEFVRQCQVAIQRFDEWARAYGKKGIVVIYDSLEKLQGVVSTGTEVLDSAAAVFIQMRHHLELPAHVIYTVPPALLARTSMPVEFFPMIKVKDKDGGSSGPGMGAARELVRRRAPDADLLEMFGPLCEKRTERVILSSGGFPRDIVRMLRQIIRQGEYPISDHEFQRVQNEAAERYQRLVTLDAYDWLARVHVEKKLVYDSEDQRKVAAHMLTNNVIMRYINDSEWYDLHPAVADITGVAKAARKIKDGAAHKQGGDGQKTS